MGEKWHQQQQRQLPQQIDVLNEFQYTINQDLQNMLGIAVEFFAIEEIKDSIDPELYKVQKNRLILQHNLSNTIHFDQQETSKARRLESQLEIMKNTGKDILTKAKQELSKQIQNFEFSEAFKILEQYERNNYGQIISIKQIPNEQTNVKGNFDDKVLSQIITAMQQTDLKYDEVRGKKNKIEFDHQQTITNNVRNRYENAKKKLSSLYQKTGQQIMMPQQKASSSNQMQEEKQNEKKYLPEIQLLLASLQYHIEKGPGNQTSQQIIDILNIHFNIYQKDNHYFKQQLDELKIELPHFQDFFPMVINHKISNSIQYLPQKYDLKQNEKDILTQNYKQAETNAKKQVIQYLINLYECYPNKITTQFKTKFEQALFQNEAEKLRKNINSTFMKEAIQNIQNKIDSQIFKKNSPNEKDDIQSLKQELNYLDK